MTPVSEWKKWDWSKIGNGTGPPYRPHIPQDIRNRDFVVKFMEWSYQKGCKHYGIEPEPLQEELGIT